MSTNNGWSNGSRYKRYEHDGEGLVPLFVCIRVYSWFLQGFDVLLPRELKDA